jgi:transposase-like protein
MKGRKHTAEQVIRKLREGERLAAEGKNVAEVARELEISEQTYSRWRNQYGGMKADDAKERRYRWRGPHGAVFRLSRLVRPKRRRAAAHR